MYPKNPYRRTAGKSKARTMSAKKRRRQQLRAKVIPGFTRTGGQYGRSLYNETKYFETSGAINIDTTAAVDISSLNLIPTGTSTTTRVGRKIVVTEIDFQGYFNWATTMTASNYTLGLCRIALVLDTQCNGASCTYQDVYDVSTSTPFAFRNMGNLQRFKVLKSWMMTPNFGCVSFDATTITCPPQKMKFYKKCTIPIEFAPTNVDGAITAIKTNNICVMAVSANGDDIHSMAGVWRIKYDDQ